MILSALDPFIAQKSLLKHAFYQKWSKGELTLEDLKVYAKEYYHLVQRVPGIVSRVRDRATDKTLRIQIEENLREETEHIELWERFASSLGITKEELVAHQPSQKVRDAVTSLEKTAEKGFDEGVAAMYAMEREIPMIAETKKEGLRDFYDLTSMDAHAYFDEHLKEEKHFAVWLSLDVHQDKATQAAKESMTAQNKVLDAVCDTCGIHC